VAHAASETRHPVYKLLESVYDAVLITSRAGKVIECNERACEFFQAEAKTLLGLDVVNLISGATDALIETINKNLINKNSHWSRRAANASTGPLSQRDRGESGRPQRAWAALFFRARHHGPSASPAGA
jgi:PAS domain-containing protein